MHKTYYGLFSGLIVFAAVVLLIRHLQDVHPIENGDASEDKKLLHWSNIPVPKIINNEKESYQVRRREKDLMKTYDAVLRAIEYNVNSAPIATKSLKILHQLVAVKLDFSKSSKFLNDTSYENFLKIYKKTLTYTNKLLTKHIVYRRSLSKQNIQSGHFGQTYRELKNISELLEPLLQEILKADQNHTLFNSKRFDEMRQKLDTYMLSINHEGVQKRNSSVSVTKLPSVGEHGVKTETSNLWSINSDEYIVLGGDEDDEGDDDDDDEYDRRERGSGDEVENGSGRPGSSGNDSFNEFATTATPHFQTMESSIDESVEEMGLVVLVDDEKDGEKSTTNFPVLYDHSSFLHINFFGPCLFCHLKEDSNSRRNKRLQFRDNILSNDYVILVQKTPSGVFTTVLSLHRDRIQFPSHKYVRVHVPLTCDCFVKAPNSRYILAGKNLSEGLVLNNFMPLYEVQSYKEVQEVHDAMRAG